MFQLRKLWTSIRPFSKSILASIIAMIVAGMVFGWAVFCALSLITMFGFAIYMLVDYLRNRFGR